jgi:hypothetical protein
VDREAPVQRAEHQVSEHEVTFLWLLLMLAGGCLGLLTGAEHLAALAAFNKTWICRFAWVACGVGVAQVGVPLAKTRLHRAFDIPTLPGAHNQRPQRIVGVFENIAYPCIFYGVANAEAATTLVVGWVGLKTLGDWEGWKAPGPRWPGDIPDVHLGRRRLYAFMLLNGLQVAIGAVVYWLMPP